MSEKPVAPDIPTDVADWGDNKVEFPLLKDLSDEELEAAEEEGKRLWGELWDVRHPSLTDSKPK